MSKVKLFLFYGVFALLSVPGCKRFQSDYVKIDLTPRATFAPVSSNLRSYDTSDILRDQLPVADEITIAGFDADTEPLAGLDVQWTTADFDGNRRWDGFDVTVMPLNARGESVRKPGGLIMELYRFDPKTLSSLGEKLLVWRIPEKSLLPTWESNRYHFRLSWWQNKPRRDNFYVVMVTTFVQHDGTVHTKTRSPLLITQSRYEIR